jgi:hypothetical protein
MYCPGDAALVSPVEYSKTLELYKSMNQQKAMCFKLEFIRSGSTLKVWQKELSFERKQLLETSKATTGSDKHLDGYSQRGYDSRSGSTESIAD